MKSTIQIEGDVRVVTLFDSFVFRLVRIEDTRFGSRGRPNNGPMEQATVARLVAFEPFTCL